MRSDETVETATAYKQQRAATFWHYGLPHLREQLARAEAIRTVEARVPHARLEHVGVRHGDTCT